MKDKRKEIMPTATPEEIEELFNSDVKAVEPEIKKFEEEVKATFHPYKAEATIPKLRVREAPNSEAESIDTVSQGQSVTIVEEKDGWGKTKYSGWVNLKYTRRV